MTLPASANVKLLSVAAHRAVEQAFAAAHPGVSLMERAAAAAFRTAGEMCGDGGRVLILAGPGNNGGDAWVLACLLSQAWYRVTVVANSPPKSPEAVAAAESLAKSGVQAVSAWPIGQFDLIVDGLFGIGLGRPPDAWSAALIHSANASRTPILALDVPSGLESDSGFAHEPCIQARRTLSFIAGKPGLFTADGPDHAGQVEVDALGTQDWVANEPGGELLAAGHPLLARPVRKRNSHKGTYGSVGIIGGAPGMAGAGFLAARAALRGGCGKVFLGLIEEGISWDPLYPEIMVRRARDVGRLDDLSVLVVGPGMGIPDPARTLLADCLKVNIPLVLDADALNLIASGKALQTQVKRRQAPTLITPHPAEAARLLGSSTAEVMRDRTGSALKLAGELRCTVILKGAGSVIASPDGRWHVNSTGNPGMASGGMGDALSGLLGALFAQGDSHQPSHTLACQGTWIHGRAADCILTREPGHAGLLASDVIDRFPEVLAGTATAR